MSSVPTHRRLFPFFFDLGTQNNRPLLLPWSPSVLIAPSAGTFLAAPPCYCFHHTRATTTVLPRRFTCAHRHGPRYGHHKSFSFKVCKTNPDHKRTPDPKPPNPSWPTDDAERGRGKLRRKSREAPGRVEKSEFSHKTRARGCKEWCG